MVCTADCMLLGDQMLRCGERLGAYRDFVGRSEGKRLLGNPRRRWKVNFKIYFEELGWRIGIDWSGLGEGNIVAFVNVVMNFRFA